MPASGQAVEQRFQDLVQDLDAIVWEADAATWRFSFVSQRAEALLGYPVEQWLTEPDFWARHIHPEDRERTIAFCQAATSEGRDHQFEYRALAVDGRVVWLRDIVRVVRDAGGRPSRLHGLTVDITERKQAEKALRETEERNRDLFEHAPVMYVITANREGVPIILDCNTLFLGTLGYSRSEVLGRPLADFYAPESRRKLGEEGGYQRALKGEFLAEERQLVTQDGRIIETFLQAGPKVEADGRISGTHAMYVDITERKRAAEALAERTRRLEAVRAVTEEITRELDLTTLLGLITRRAAELVGAVSGVVYLLDDTAQGLVPKAWYGLGEWMRKVHLQLGEGAPGTAAQRREGMIVNDYRTSPYALPLFLERTGITANVSEPLLYGDRLLGVITINNEGTGRPFTEQDREILALFANQAAIAIENARLVGAREEAKRVLEQLYTVGVSLHASRELVDRLRGFLRGVREAVGFDRVNVFLLSPDQSSLELVVSAEGEVPETPIRISLESAGPFAEAIRTRRPLLIQRKEDIQALPSFDPALSGLPIFRSTRFAVIPLVAGDQVVGVVGADNKVSRRPISSASVEQLQLFCQQLAVAMDNARLYETTFRRAHQLATLNTLARTLTTALDPQAVGREILAALLTLIPGAAGHLWERVGEEDAYRLFASIGLREPEGGLTLTLGPGEGLIGLAALTRQPITSWDVTQDPRFASKAWAVAEGLVSGIVVPLLYGERVTGAFAIFTRAPHDFTDEEVGLLRAFAAHAAIALKNARLFQQEQARRQEAEGLEAVGRDLAQSLDLAVVGNRIVERIRELLRLGFSRLYRLEPATGNLVAVASSGDLDPASLGKLVFPPGTGGVGLAVRDRSTVISTDIFADPRITTPPELRDLVGRFRSVIAIPLFVGERVIGALAVGGEAGRTFSDDEVRMAQSFANQAVLALENARLVEDLKTHQGRLETLLETSRQLSGVQPLETLLESIAHACGHLLDTDLVILRLVEGDDLVIAEVWGAEKDTITTPRLKIGESLSGLVAATGEPLIVPDPVNDPRLIPAHRENYRRLGLRDYLGVPIMAGGSVVGVLSMHTRPERGFTDEDLAIATAFASQAGIALENARLVKDLRQALDDLKAAQEQVVRGATLQAVGELASGMAHHLNNLLAVVLGRIDLLLLKVREPDIRRSLESAGQAARDGAEVVRRVQRFSRLQPISELVPVDLNQLVSEVLALIQPLWRDRAQVQGIQIQVSLEPGEIPAIAGEPASLREVIMNLLLNAVDALPEGGKVTVKTWASEQGVYCSVSDTGVGMPEEIRGRILEPFFTTKGPKSTGLGLSVSYAIIQRHGGDLAIESAEGRGTTVTIRLPLAPAPTVAKPVGGIPRGGTLTILVIEDEAEVLSVLSEMLTTQGHKVLQATGGREGLARLEAGEPVDLVLTDLGMPGMTGWDVARAVKGRWPHLPVGLVTGWGETPATSPEEARWVDFVLPKPVTRERLSEAVARIRLKPPTT